MGRYLGSKTGLYNKVKCSCVICNTDFLTYKSQIREYCSRPCFYKHKSNAMKGEKHFFYGKNHTEKSRKKISVSKAGKKFVLHPPIKYICNFCKKEFFAYLSTDNKYCSRKCYDKSLIGKESFFKGRKHSKENREKISLRKKGSHWGHHTAETKNKIRLCHLGPKNWNWKGGASGEARTARNSMFHREWRKQVFDRDNYTCQDCGGRSIAGHRIILHPHHIKEFSLYPALRFEVSNGLTLCKDCHKKTYNYGATKRKNRHDAEKNAV